MGLDRQLRDQSRQTSHYVYSDHGRFSFLLQIHNLPKPYGDCELVHPVSVPECQQDYKLKELSKNVGAMMST